MVWEYTYVLQCEKRLICLNAFRLSAGGASETFPAALCKYVKLLTGFVFIHCVVVWLNSPQLGA